VVSSAALTLRGYAEQVSGWFHRKPELRFLPFDEWKAHFTEKDARITFDHIARSPNCSIEKARRLFGYEPRYSSLEAVRESVDSLIARGELAVSSLGTAS
jgi:nucleoside-diphosphate-sugar epimerase